ncbi:LOW QUALITY PROTEIN: titin-like [Atheta coriaria]|uniref:LOW QUALITY PROTEIN: titin-like n=1 Tax=Dalotia coriaria TaxID=877792 RepID=UPI0031F426D6
MLNHSPPAVPTEHIQEPELTTIETTVTTTKIEETVSHDKEDKESILLKNVSSKIADFIEKEKQQLEAILDSPPTKTQRKKNKGKDKDSDFTDSVSSEVSVSEEAAKDTTIQPVIIDEPQTVTTTEVVTVTIVEKTENEITPDKKKKKGKKTPKVSESEPVVEPVSTPAVEVVAVEEPKKIDYKGLPVDETSSLFENILDEPMVFSDDEPAQEQPLIPVEIVQTETIITTETIEPIVTEQSFATPGKIERKKSKKIKKLPPKEDTPKSEEPTLKPSETEIKEETLQQVTETVSAFIQQEKVQEPEPTIILSTTIEEISTPVPEEESPTSDSGDKIKTKKSKTGKKDKQSVPKLEDTIEEVVFEQTSAIEPIVKEEITIVSETIELESPKSNKKDKKKKSKSSEIKTNEIVAVAETVLSTTVEETVQIPEIVEVADVSNAEILVKEESPKSSKKDKQAKKIPTEFIVDESTLVPTNIEAEMQKCTFKTPETPETEEKIAAIVPDVSECFIATEKQEALKDEEVKKPETPRSSRKEKNKKKRTKSETEDKHLDIKTNAEEIKLDVVETVKETTENIQNNVSLEIKQVVPVSSEEPINVPKSSKNDKKAKSKPEQVKIEDKEEITNAKVVQSAHEIVALIEAERQNALHEEVRKDDSDSSRGSKKDKKRNVLNQQVKVNLKNQIVSTETMISETTIETPTVETKEIITIMETEQQQTLVEQVPKIESPRSSKKDKKQRTKSENEKKPDEIKTEIVPDQEVMGTISTEVAAKEEKPIEKIEIVEEVTKVSKEPSAEDIPKAEVSPKLSKKDKKKKTKTISESEVLSEPVVSVTTEVVPETKVETTTIVQTTEDIVTFIDTEKQASITDSPRSSKKDKKRRKAPSETENKPEEIVLAPVEVLEECKPETLETSLTSEMIEVVKEVIAEPVTAEVSSPRSSKKDKKRKPKTKSESESKLEDLAAEKQLVTPEIKEVVQEIQTFIESEKQNILSEEATKPDSPRSSKKNKKKKPAVPEIESKPENTEVEVLSLIEVQPEVIEVTQTITEIVEAVKVEPLQESLIDEKLIENVLPEPSKRDKRKKKPRTKSETEKQPEELVAEKEISNTDLIATQELPKPEITQVTPESSPGVVVENQVIITEEALKTDSPRSSKKDKKKKKTASESEKQPENVEVLLTTEVKSETILIVQPVTEIVNVVEPILEPLLDEKHVESVLPEPTKRDKKNKKPRTKSETEKQPKELLVEKEIPNTDLIATDELPKPEITQVTTEILTEVVVENRVIVTDEAPKTDSLRSSKKDKKKKKKTESESEKQLENVEVEVLLTSEVKSETIEIVPPVTEIVNVVEPTLEPLLDEKLIEDVLPEPTRRDKKKKKPRTKSETEKQPEEQPKLESDAAVVVVEKQVVSSDEAIKPDSPRSSKKDKKKKRQYLKLKNNPKLLRQKF